MNRLSRTAWAERKIAEIGRQLDALPKATDWRQRQRIGEAASRLYRQRARYRRMIPESYDESLPF